MNAFPIASGDAVIHSVYYTLEPEEQIPEEIKRKKLNSIESIRFTGSPSLIGSRWLLTTSSASEVF